MHRGFFFSEIRLRRCTYTKRDAMRRFMRETNFKQNTGVMFSIQFQIVRNTYAQYKLFLMKEKCNRRSTDRSHFQGFCQRSLAEGKGVIRIQRKFFSLE